MAMPDTSLTITEAELEGTIGTRFDKVAATVPTRPAVSAHGHSLTYQELANVANTIAHQLVEQLGGGWGTVALLVHEPVARAAAMLGAVKANKAFTVLDESQPQFRLATIVRDLCAQAIIHDLECGELAHRLTVAAGAPTRACLVAGVPAPSSPIRGPELDIGPNTLAMIIYTSGSTGESKGVMREHRMVLNRARMAQRLDEARVTDRQAVLASSSFSAALNGLFVSLLSGGCECLIDFRDVGILGLGHWLDERHITLVALNVALARQWCDALASPVSLPHLRKLQLIGSRALRRDALSLRAHLQGTWQLTTTYSSTEATVSTHNHVADPSLLKDGPLPLGPGTPDRELLILDDAHRPLAPGMTGEVAVRSRFIAAGYWRTPALTQARFLPDSTVTGLRTFLTGDYGRLSATGVLDVFGRKDAIVKVRGYRVSLDEVENALLAVPHVSEAAVRARERTGSDNELIAYASAADGFGLTRTDVRLALAQRLPHFMLPKHIVLLDSFPLLANGKLDRAALPDPLDDERDLKEIIPPRDDIEALIERAWCKVLHREHISVHSHFADVGGDSFSAALVELELATTLAQHISMADLARAVTISEQALLVRRYAQPEDAESARALSPVPLNDASPDLAPLFCLPAHDGSGAHFRPLAQGLKWPMYALELPRQEVVQTLGSFERLAPYLLAQMRAVQPCGPYFVLASCVMSKLALTLCDALVTSGQEIGACVLIDVPLASKGLRDHAQTLRHHSAWLKQIMRSLARETRLSGVWPVARLIAATLHDISRRVTHPLRLRMTQRQKDLHSSFIEMGDAFVPKRWDCDVIFVKGAWSQSSRFYDGTSKMMGWDSFLPKAQLIVVPASHSSMLKAPFVTALARDLAHGLMQYRVLAEAQSPD